MLIPEELRLSLPPLALWVNKRWTTLLRRRLGPEVNALELSMIMKPRRTTKCHYVKVPLELCSRSKSLLTRVGELVSDIQRIDPDWWLVTNEAGQVSYILLRPGDKAC